MNEEYKRKWIEALRSGEYTQVQGALFERVNEKDCFCGLGVLSDVVDPSLWNRDAGINYLEDIQYTGSAKFLAQVVTDATGVTYDIEDHIYQLNDVGRATFNDIADWIEENL